MGRAVVVRSNLRRWRTPAGWAKVATLFVIASWAGFFAYLWLTGNVTRYLGPRTQWVVVFGAVVLVGLTVSQSLGLRLSRSSLSAGELAGLIITLLPIVVLIAVPSASLGSVAAAKKAVGPTSTLSSAPHPSGPTGPPSFIDIHYASHSAAYAARAGIAAGDPVRLVGFVTHKQHTGSFSLTRFYVYCCLADAVPYSVDVVAPSGTDFKDNTWLQVRGQLARSSGELMVRASSAKKVQQPNPPYLY